MSGAYGPGGAANSFLHGAMGAANLVHGIARDNRNDAENTRRYNVEQERLNRTEQRQLDAETGKRSAMRVQELMRRHNGNWDEMMRDPATVALVNQDPAFADVAGYLRENKNVRKDDPLTGFVEFNRGGKTIYTMQAAVDNGRGEYVSKPVSIGRGTTDDVRTFTSDQFRSSVMSKLAPFGLQDMATTIKAHQTLADADRAPAAAPVRQQNTVTSPTAVASAPATTTTVDDKVLSATGVQPAPQGAPDLSTLRGQRSLVAPTTMKPEEIAPRNAQQSIRPTTNNPVFIEAAREEAEAALRDGKAGVYNQDVLRTALQSPKLNDQARAEIEAIVKPNADPTAELAEVARVAKANMTAQFGDAAKHLTPGIVASPKQQDKLAKALPPNITPEVRQQAAEIVQRAPAKRRRTADELGAAIVAGVTGDALTRFAKGGSITKADLHAFNPEHDLYDGDRLVRKGVPKVDAAAHRAVTKERRDLIKDGETRYKGYVESFEPKGMKGPVRYPYAEARTMAMESYNDLVRLKVIPADVSLDEFFGMSSNGAALVSMAYKNAKDKSAPASMFKAEVKRSIADSAAELWPDLARAQPEIKTGANGKRYILVDGVPKEVRN